VTPGFEVFPAIDLLGGRCVRLYQGDYDRATTYGDDPAAQAAAFCDEGARWLHVVDLDAARSGSPANLAAIGAIAGRSALPSLLWAMGSVTFAGTLYAMALGAPRWFGAITPIGGLWLIAGWVVLAWTSRKES